MWKQPNTTDASGRADPLAVILVGRRGNLLTVILVGRRENLLTVILSGVERSGTESKDPPSGCRRLASAGDLSTTRLAALRSDDVSNESK